MYAYFLYWHTYYDATFLKETIRVSPALLQDLGISSETLVEWPSLEKLPQLLKCFKIFQQFIMAEENWTGSCCAQLEMKEIQFKINNILILLQCEKKYGNDFWHVDVKRIQASVVHFILILQQFFVAILPNCCDSILKAKQINKLCVKTELIEGLVNNILKHINQIYNFMLSQQFQEEKPLTIEFFQNFSNIIKFLPKVPKQKLLEKPRIAEFIRIINSLQVEDQTYQKKQLLRDKSKTVFSKNQLTPPNQIDIFERNLKPMVRPRENFNSEREFADIFSPTKSSPKEMNPLFKFTQKLRKASIYNMRKTKQTISTNYLDSREKNSREKSPSSNQFYDNSPEIKNRGLAQSLIFQNRSPQITITRSRETEYSAQSAISKLSKSQKKKYIMQKDQNEHERDGKVKKKKAIKIIASSNKYSGKINILDGRPKGWGLIRQNVSRAIAEAKVKNLLMY